MIVIVNVERDPECRTNVSLTEIDEHEMFVMSCEITYSGQLTPRVTWTRRNHSQVTQVTL